MATPPTFELPKEPVDNHLASANQF